jgi:hypothetical protein
MASTYYTGINCVRPRRIQILITILSSLYRDENGQWRTRVGHIVRWEVGYSPDQFGAAREL